jgi:hypothetical protein
VGIVPPTPNFAGAEFPTAAKLNQIQTALNFLMNPPRAQVNVGAAQNNTTTGVYQSILFDAEAVDTDGMHDLVTNNSRLTVQTPGKYLVTGQVIFAFSATGRRLARLVVNNTGAGALGETEVATSTVAGSSTAVPVSGQELSLVAGDFIELQAFQNSGGNLGYGTGIKTFLRAQWIGA